MSMSFNVRLFIATTITLQQLETEYHPVCTEIRNVFTSLSVRYDINGYPISWYFHLLPNPAWYNHALSIPLAGPSKP